MRQSDTIANNKRIAKNTIILYVRMIVVTLLSLVTVRYTLQLLGEDDFGVYNVVAGVVTFMSFITATISSATQRFLAFKLGENDARGYNDMFNMLLIVFVGVALLVCVVLEAISYPVVYHWLQIPVDRLDDAFAVYHLSVLSFFFMVASMPFLSSILAHERMGVYAYVAIADTVSKLGILALLFINDANRLIVYAIGMTAVTIITNLIYVAYNQRYIPNTSIYFCWKKRILRHIASYTGWSFFGAISSILCMHGLTILINLFFGVAANAAKAISDRVQGVVQSFVMNFYMAVSPQITKSYAANDQSYALRLAYTSTRLAYFLMLIIITPVIILADKLLALWLGDDCSADMVMFTRLSLVFVLVNVFETPITFLIRATGNIKRYQVFVGCVTLLVVPVSVLLFVLGCDAYAVFIALNAVYVVAQVIRVVVLKRYYATSLRHYFSEVMMRSLLVTLLLCSAFAAMEYANMHILLNAAIVTLVCLPVTIWLLGVKQNERTYIKEFIKRKIHI